MKKMRKIFKVLCKKNTLDVLLSVNKYNTVTMRTLQSIYTNCKKPTLEKIRNDLLGCGLIKSEKSVNSKDMRIRYYSIKDKDLVNKIINLLR